MEASKFVFAKFIFYVGNHIYWQKSFLHPMKKKMKKFNQRNILGSTSFVSPGWSPQPAQPCLVWFTNPLAAGSQMDTLSHLFPLQPPRPLGTPRSTSVHHKYHCLPVSTASSTSSDQIDFMSLPERQTSDKNQHISMIHIPGWVDLKFQEKQRQVERRRDKEWQGETRRGSLPPRATEAGTAGEAQEHVWRPQARCRHILRPRTWHLAP